MRSEPLSLKLFAGALAALLLLSCAPLRGAQNSETPQQGIRVQVNLVNLFATVRDKKTKQIISSLEQSDFKITEDGAFGGWLMPIVPPMVSAATGALLVPYAAAGQARLTLLIACYAMFGISLFISVIIITLLWGRLVTYKTLPAVMVPTCWIVLGPLGQSVTAAGNLANVGALTLRAPYPAGADAFALLYGIPTWGFAMLWLAIAGSLTVRAARKGLPFGLTWWSFTFPVGTCVTGTIGLAARTGDDALRYAAAALFVLLVAAWLTVAVRTVRDGYRGRLFRPAAPAAAAAPVPPVA